jgi:tetratricopeptide (TPR) repeat protein
LIAQRKYREALAELDEALRLEPGVAQALNARGFAYFMLKEYANALKDLDAALERNPNYANALQIRAQTRKAAGDPQGAAEDAARLRELSKK